MIEWKIIAPEIEYLFGMICFFGSMFAWTFPAIFLHECGHALAAGLFGFKVQSIEIGSGKRVLFSYRYRGINLLIKERPTGGRTHIDKMNLMNGARWKQMVIVCAGPFTDGVILIVLFFAALFFANSGNKTLGHISLGFFIPQFLSLLASLIPRTIRRDGESFPNDTKIMSRLFLAGKEQMEMKAAMEGIAKTLIRYYDRNYQPNASSGFFADEWTLLRKYYEAEEFLEKMQFEKAITWFKEILSSGLLQDAEKAYVLDRMARLPTIYEQKQYLEEAFAWIAEARQLAPSSITLQGTYGSLLIESHQINQAIEVLKMVFDEANEVLVKAMASAYLAEAYERLGAKDQTEFWLQNHDALEAQL